MSKHDIIINKIKAIASGLFKEKKGEVYIFGSQARREANEFSDWDLLILTEEKLTREENFNKYGFPFCEMGWSQQEDINPLVYSKDEWASQKQTYFYHNVMSDAIKIYS